MSDFLSKFSGDKYTELLETDQKNPENESKELEKNSVVSASSEDEAHQIPTVIPAVDTDENGLSSQSVNLETPEEAPVRYDRAKKRRDDFHEEVEIDPT